MPSVTKVSDFSDPSRTITYFEGDENDHGVENSGGDGPTDNPLMARYIRHDAGAFYLYDDGHANRRLAGSLVLSEFVP